MMVNEIELIFSQLGGVFCTPADQMSQKLKHIKAFVFDWDGVFNNAVKNENKSSNFNEADSMGTNLVRFNHYLLNGQLPNTAIISGEKNEMAFYFCNREHFSASYYKIPNKTVALTHFCLTHQIKEHEVCYMFDDVLDLSIAAICGLRILINRKANPLFTNYVIKNNLADYVTAHESGNFAVREACELIMGLSGTYDSIMEHRTAYTPAYAKYINERQLVDTVFFTNKDGIIASEITL